MGAITTRFRISSDFSLKGSNSGLVVMMRLCSGYGAFAALGPQAVSAGRVNDLPAIVKFIPE
jgi:hypothetical protein